MVTLFVDDHTITARSGLSLLAVCLENGIYIPHLCYLKGEERPAASCRLCFVEIEGGTVPVPACTVTVQADMRVETDTPSVRRLQRTALRLLLSAHDVNCKECHANRACALQDIARFLKVSLKPKPLPHIERATEIDTSHPCIDHHPHRCVLCGKCVRICRHRHDHPAFSFVGRGIDAVIKHYPSSLFQESHCRDCHDCVDICPVGALQLRDTSTDQ